MREDVCIVLTCTINVCGVSFTERNNTDERHIDYQVSLRKWMVDKHIKKIILVENSGYDLSLLKEISIKVGSDKEVEFISFDGQDFPRHLGKGYGEAISLERVAQDSCILGETNRFIKINGRYYVPNINKFIKKIGSNAEIMTDLSRNLLWSDSRVFGGSAKFIRDYLCIEGRKVNDSEGYYLEHALARATHRAIADGMVWVPIPCSPYIDGISGTSNVPYRKSFLRRVFKNIYLSAKSALLSI